MSKFARNRRSAYKRDRSKRDNYGARLFHEVKRYDGEGNLIGTITPDELIARPIGAERKFQTKWQKRTRHAQLQKTNGEGSLEDWSKIAAKVNKGSKVNYTKEIV
jgi:hypothetical protein